MNGACIFTEVKKHAYKANMKLGRKVSVSYAVGKSKVFGEKEKVPRKRDKKGHPFFSSVMQDEVSNL